jgi:diguanylate cyclase (GGDEF)-like protein
MLKLSDLVSSFRPQHTSGIQDTEPHVERERGESKRSEDGHQAMEDRYRLLSESLERRVAERTSQLEEANRALQKEVEERERAQLELQRANERLAESLRTLERHAAQLDQLGQMSDLLQTCTSVDETCAVAARYADSLFPSRGGGIFLINRARNLAEAAVTWGDVPAAQQLFAPDDCWAVRRGRVHPANGLQTELPCRHVGESCGDHVCAPLIANGETLGVLQLRGCAAQADSHSRALLGTVAERTALALANLRLREGLLAQSIRDSLTGLYNRRYLEESMQIEERRSQRSGQPFGILMLDLDRFKQINDAHGHDAGDYVLRQFAQVLQRQTRSGDIACRYGGEEFTVILPGASRDASMQRARHLRACLAATRFVYLGQDLGGVTVSIGVAAFPDDGRDGLSVLQQADHALYRAKAAGRDRVE